MASENFPSRLVQPKTGFSGISTRARKSISKARTWTQSAGAHSKPLSWNWHYRSMCSLAMSNRTPRCRTEWLWERYSRDFVVQVGCSCTIGPLGSTPVPHWRGYRSAIWGSKDVASRSNRLSDSIRSSTGTPRARLTIYAHPCALNSQSSFYL